MELTAAYTDPLRRQIVREEGLKRYAYKDSAGFWTIGIGHKLRENEEYMKGYTPTNLAPDWLIDKLYDTDISDAKGAIGALKVPKPLNANQTAALVSLYFNTGPQLFRNKDGSRTGIYEALMAGDYNRVADEILRWKNAGGKPVLLARRERERELFLA